LFNKKFSGRNKICGGQKNWAALPRIPPRCYGPDTQSVHKRISAFFLCCPSALASKMFRFQPT